jgi:hypothetical protein
VAVISVSLKVILIFMLSVLAGDVSVGGATVGVAVGGALVSVTGAAVGVGGTAVGDKVSTGVTEACGDGVDMAADEQAATRTAARISTLI